MKKIFKFAAGLLSLGIIVLLATGRMEARLTGTDPGTDIWCNGPSGQEVCLDVDGDFYPTTDNDTTLGASTLRWATIFAYDLTLSDDLTVADAATVTGNFIKTSPSAQTLTVTGQALAADACGGVKLVNAPHSFTLAAASPIATPAAANTGCFMIIKNATESLGTITIPSGALFYSKGWPSADNLVVLGTNDSIQVYSDGSRWYQVGSPVDL